MSAIDTFTGRRFDLLDPDPADVDLRDIAHALALTCRFAGHVPNHYSVAEHCVRLVDAERAEARQAGQPRTRAELQWLLFHDAAEAYVGDMTAPLKSLVPTYADIERRILAAIAQALGLGPCPDAVVKAADVRMLATERRDLFSAAPRPWHPAVEAATPYRDPIIPWPAEKAEALFLTRAGTLLCGNGNAFHA